MRYIDFHTHILPEMDDGAKSVGESLEILKTAHLSGAQTVLLTPHFLTREPVPDFCARRNSKYALLKKAMEEMFHLAYQPQPYLLLIIPLILLSLQTDPTPQYSHHL